MAGVSEGVAITATFEGVCTTVPFEGVEAAVTSKGVLVAAGSESVEAWFLPEETNIIKNSFIDVGLYVLFNNVRTNLIRSIQRAICKWGSWTTS